MLYIQAVTIESFLKQGEQHYTRKTMPENVKNIWTPPTPLKRLALVVQKSQDKSVHYAYTFSFGLQESDCLLDSDLSSALRCHEQPINQQQPDKLTELFSL